MQEIKKRIAIGGISTECSTYSSLHQNEKDFECIQNNELLDLIEFPFKKYNIELCPIFFNRSVPGGPIETSYFSKIKDEFVKQLKKTNSLDGVLLIMHGAMFVPNINDPEGEWISSVRDVVGKDCIISVSFDLHGQITNKIIKNIDAFTAFRTAPHIDILKTYKRASQMLVNALTTGVRPNVIWSAIPVLVSGEMSSTFIDPCKSIYSNLDEFDKREGVLDSNLMVGYVWADTERATASAVVTCTNIKSGAIVCREIANLYWNSRKKLKFNMRSGDIHTAIAWLPNTFSILADSGDNPTAGGVGDRADVLEIMLKENIQNVLFAGISSTSAYNQLLKQNKFTIGGSLGGGGPTLNLVADDVFFKEECAVVTVQNTRIVISKCRRPFHYLSDFEKLNLYVKDYSVLVVKSGYLSPDLQDLSVPSYIILTNGAANQHLQQIENKNRKKPIFPFQNFNEFIPIVSDGLNIITSNIN